MKQRNIFVILSLVVIGMLSNGCVAPGSALGRVGLSGVITDSENLKDIKIRAILPETYGLGGLDMFFGKPSDYGNADHVGIAAIDSSGQFNINFEPTVYHAAFWLIPPLGFQPKYPSDPFFAIQFSNTPDQIYLVQKKWGEIKYEVWQLPEKKEITSDNAFWRIVSGMIEETMFDYKERKLNGKIMKLEISKQKSNETRTSKRD